MYKVRFAGGSVAAELQLIDNVSPIKYLENKIQSHRHLRTWHDAPVLSSVNPGPVLGDDHDEEVAVLAVRGKHRTLLTHLAPVAARAGLGARRYIKGESKVYLSIPNGLFGYPGVT